MIDKRVCIAGLGLMGGSLARALQGHVTELIGVDHHAATRQRVLAEGVVDVVTADLAAALPQADLLILATPVQTILQHIEQLPQICPGGLWVMDLGSTKEAVCRKMNALPAAFAAIGGHPMCGKESAGFAAAEGSLFEDQTFVLSRSTRTSPELEALALQIIKQIGAQPLFMDPQEHDRIVAVTSHLPYLLATMLIRRALSVEDDRVWPVSASGFRDSSRLAGSDPAMMLDILLTNKAAILPVLSHYAADLQQIHDLLADQDPADLAAWLEASQKGYNIYRQHKQL